jgi:hypothetical protein
MSGGQLPIITAEQRRAREQYIESLTLGRQMFRVSELLKMTPVFQRNVNRVLVAKIIREWQPHRFDEPVVVITSDGTHLLDDGQHRVIAAERKLGADAELQCRIAYTDLPGVEFVAINTSRTAVSAFWKFTAHLSDGDKTATGITALVERHGMVIGNNSNVRAISGVNTMTALYQKDADALDRALAVLAAVITRRENEGGWLRANVIQSVWYVMRTYNCDDKRMIYGLAKSTPERVAPLSSNEPARNAGAVIAAYNRNLPERNRINILEPKVSR